MPTATKPKLPPIMLGVTLKVPLRSFKKKLEEILSGDERRRMKITKSDVMYAGPSNYLIIGPPTVFEKMSGVKVEYTFENEYVPKTFPGLTPTTEMMPLMESPPKILNRGRSINRSFYSGVNKNSF